jgi:hypothetical protein
MVAMRTIDPVAVVAPRLLGLATAGLFALFAFDSFVFQWLPPDMIAIRALRFVPALVVLMLVLLGWYKPLAGGLGFLVVATLYSLMTVALRQDWTAAIWGPLTAVGLAFLWTWYKQQHVGVEDGPSRLEAFAVYINSYIVGVIGLVAALDDSIAPIWFAASIVGMTFLPLALVGLALMPVGVRRGWYFVRLAVALGVVLTALAPMIEAPSDKVVESSYVAGILGLLAVSAVMRGVSAWCQAPNRERGWTSGRQRSTM